MRLQELQEAVRQELKEYYPLTEVDSFFYRLAEDYLGYTRFEVSLHEQEEISAKAKENFFSALKRLKNHEPIQYILRKTEFYGLSLAVNPTVLIPRPETEELVDLIISQHKDRQDLTVVDLCTGSGCIALALANHLKSAEVTGVDISTGALETARYNAAQLQIPVTFLEKDVLTGSLDIKNVDILVSNPPYVRNLEQKEMSANVLNYEPHLALFVENEDPLLFYRYIAEMAKKTLSPTGVVYCEINEYLGKETKQLFKDARFSMVEVKKDLFGKDRIVKAFL
ncbi:peptide chain release factor N(5)-glutamine methyltransferase [Gangjinia marincola]|uniref:Release factor glutamine methyltransferase n=1 Tax=Gangjinia marincola TaxID=578463 RepID=A0ABN1MEU5_9FLAO